MNDDASTHRDAHSKQDMSFTMCFHHLVFTCLACFNSIYMDVQGSSYIKSHAVSCSVSIMVAEHASQVTSEDGRVISMNVPIQENVQARCVSETTYMHDKVNI